MRQDLQDIAKSFALEARARFNLHPLEPVLIFKKVYPFTNIICLKEPIPDDISGIYTNADDAKVIIINTSKTVGHQNFTAAHELYHAIYEKNKVDLICKAGIFDFSNESEAVADLFAAYFLMPKEAIRHHLAIKIKSRKTIELEDIVYLEQLFQTSHASMIRRLEDLKILKRQQGKEFLPNIRRTALLLGYSDYLYRPTNDQELISDFITKVTKAYRKNKISRARYLELLADFDVPDESDVEGVEDYVD